MHKVIAAAKVPTEELEVIAGQVFHEAAARAEETREGTSAQLQLLVSVDVVVLEDLSDLFKIVEINIVLVLNIVDL